MHGAAYQNPMIACTWQRRSFGCVRRAEHTARQARREVSAEFFEAG
jgi:hypothetical protein